MVVDLNKTQPSEKNKNIRVTEIVTNEKLYRGDSNKYNNYDIHNLLDDEYKFFGLTLEEVEEYGVIFKFTLNRPLYLVRLDDKNTRNELYKIGDAKIKKILERNYGHNKGEFRDSEEGADYEMSSFICKNYDGYITDKMKSYHFGGEFHREVMICNPKNKFSKVEQITKPEQANKMRTEYSLKLHELKEAKTRKKKKSRSYFDEDDEENIPATKMNAFSYASPMKTTNMSDFSTPTKGQNVANRALSFATPGGSRRKSRKRRKSKTKKSKKRKSKKHGGNSYKSGTWVPFNNIKPDELCAICQDPLQSSEQIADKGLIYQLSCGHQFHNNCLSGWCDNRIKSVKLPNRNEEIHRPATLFKCPVCNQTTLHEEDDCTSMESYRDDFLGDGEIYTTEKYTGIKPEPEPEPEPESKPRNMFNFFKKGGKRKSRKSKKRFRKTRSTRQRGGNPNDQEEKDTYLFGAIGIYDYDKVENALNNGANVNAKNDDGDTPLILAIKLEDIDMVYLLLERPDINIELDLATNKELQLAEDLWDDMTPEEQEENSIPYAIEDYIITKKEKKRIQNIVAQTIPKVLERQEDRKNLAMVMSEKDVGNRGDGTMPYELRHEIGKYLGGEKRRTRKKNRKKNRKK